MALDQAHSFREEAQNGTPSLSLKLGPTGVSTSLVLGLGCRPRLSRTQVRVRSVELLRGLADCGDSEWMMTFETNPISIFAQPGSEGLSSLRLELARRNTCS